MACRPLAAKLGKVDAKDIELVPAVPADYGLYRALFPLIEAEVQLVDRDTFASVVVPGTLVIRARSEPSPDSASKASVGYIYGKTRTNGFDHHVNHVVVAREFQGRGIGTAAFTAYVQWISSRTVCKRLLLDCDVKHEYQVRWYTERLRMRSVGLLHHYKVETTRGTAANGVANRFGVVPFSPAAHGSIVANARAESADASTQTCLDHYRFLDPLRDNPANVALLILDAEEDPVGLAYYNAAFASIGSVHLFSPKKAESFWEAVLNRVPAGDVSVFVRVAEDALGGDSSSKGTVVDGLLRAAPRAAFSALLRLLSLDLCRRSD